MSLRTIETNMRWVIASAGDMKIKLVKIYPCDFDQNPAETTNILKSAQQFFPSIMGRNIVTSAHANGHPLTFAVTADDNAVVGFSYTDAKGQTLIGIDPDADITGLKSALITESLLTAPPRRSQNRGPLAVAAALVIGAAAGAVAYKRVQHGQLSLGK